MSAEDSDVVAEEETGSEVVVLEDEDDGSPKARGGKKPRKLVDEGDVDLADDDLEEGASASAALKGVKSRRLDDEDEGVEVAGRLAPRAWGVLPAIILFPALLIVMLGGIMGYELLHTMMGYQQPRKPAAPLVRGIAKTLDMELKDQ